jgi:hypothetical protein
MEPLEWRVVRPRQTTLVGVSEKHIDAFEPSVSESLDPTRNRYVLMQLRISRGQQLRMIVTRDLVRACPEALPVFSGVPRRLP